MICIFETGRMLVLAATAFTLSWTHSVERSRWEEDWQITPAGLAIVEARIRGSGAGMEPSAEAELENGWWVYVPFVPPQEELLLAASGETTEGWDLCAADQCMEIGASSGQPVRIRACRRDGQGFNPEERERYKILDTQPPHP